MLRNLQKLFFLVLFVSTLAISPTNSVEAAQGSVSVSPNPVPVNSNVQIQISATDPGSAIQIIELLIDTQVQGGNEDSYVCEDGFGNPVDNCSHVFTKKFTSQGTHIISGIIVLNTGASVSIPGVSLTVGNSEAPGTDPPTITNIIPNPVKMGSVISISGTKFCSEGVAFFEDSLIEIRFDQTSSGGQKISTTPVSGSNCNVLKAKVPTSLLENNAKVTVKNTKGESPSTGLAIEANPTGGDGEGNGTNTSDYMETGGFMNWPPSPGGTDLTENSKLPDLIKYLYEWGIGLGGLGVFVSLVIAGIQYLTSFGNPVSMKEAMSRIQSTIIGLILLLSSWLILNTINPDLTSFSVSFDWNTPEGMVIDPSELDVTPRSCSYVMLAHTVPGETRNPVKILMNGSTDIVFDIGQIKSSVGYSYDKKTGENIEDKSCQGQLKFYRKNCKDQIGTMGPTNKNITIDEDDVVKCIRFSE